MRRHGFTMLELLVVLGILAVVAAIALPAIQYARESSRRSACSNNLRQIGLGLNQYAEVHGMFPLFVPGSMPSHLLQILPFVDMQNLFDEYNFEDPRDKHNRLVSSESIPLFICPSAAVPIDDFLYSGPTNYPGNGGSGEWQRFGDGIFLDQEIGLAVRFKSITDGASRTAASAEAQVSPYELIAGDDYRPLRLEHVIVFLRDAEATDREKFSQSCMALVPKPGLGQTKRIHWDTYSLFFGALYNHQLPPDSPSCIPEMTMIYPHKFAFSSSSLHGGGVYVLMADASVQWTNSSVDREVWRAMGSIDGSESL
ncbi:MAG: DUF1559 domain-containing protein [Planctomycetia bacterium]